MAVQKVDILAFGAHPDDVELGCGGSLLVHIAKGYKVAIVDFTKGELGTRGDAETRLQEAESARKILGASYRENLGLEDGFFRKDKESILEIVKMLRHFRPEVVFGNSIEDRHPDHSRAAEMVKDAIFLSGLQKIETHYQQEIQAPWRPKAYYNYIQSNSLEIDLAIDFSGFMDTKLKAVLAYKTQFHNAESTETNTFISTPTFMEIVESRAKDIGYLIGVKHAEGFTKNRYIGVKDVLEIL